MNEVIQTILNRRSVRVYSNEPIKPEDLELILKSGQYAPSACNTQPWHFTVVQSKELIDTLSVDTKIELSNCENDYFKEFAKNEKYNVFYNAPAIIIVSGEKSSMVPETDCAAAAENMILAADSLDIGSCWVGLLAFLFKGKKEQEYLEKLQIPHGYEPYYAVTLGYKKYPTPKPQPRRENTISYIK